MTHAPCMLDNLGYKHNLVYVIFTAFPLQILLEENTRTQARTEDVEMKEQVQTQSAYNCNLHFGNHCIYS